MKTLKNLDKAFEAFSNEIAEMDPSSFFELLGISVEELYAKNLLPYKSGINIPPYGCNINSLTRYNCDLDCA